MNNTENLRESIRDGVATWVSEHSVQNNSVAAFISKYRRYMPACRCIGLVVVRTSENTEVKSATRPIIPDHQLPHFISFSPVLRVSQVSDEWNVMTYESTAIFYVSCFLYMSVSVAFSRGKPFRTPIYRNYAFLLSLLVLVAFTVFLMYWPPLPLSNFMMDRVIPDHNFLSVLLALATIHFVASVSFEMLVIEQPAVWKVLRRSRCFRRMKRTPVKRYKTLIRMFGKDKNGFDPLDRSPLPVYHPTKLVTGQVFVSEVRPESVRTCVWVALASPVTSASLVPTLPCCCYDVTDARFLLFVSFSTFFETSLIQQRCWQQQCFEIKNQHLNSVQLAGSIPV